jgi:membrane protein
MTAPRAAGFIKQFWQQGVATALSLNVRTHGWLGILVDAAREALKPDSAMTAAAIAYFALLSLFPLTLLSISIASFTLGPLIDRQLIVQKLEFIAPALGQLFGRNIEEIFRARGPITIVAVVGLVWSGSTIFYTLTQTLSGIWSNKRRRPVWKRRGLAILFVLVLAGPALFLASFASSMMTNFNNWLPSQAIPIMGGFSYIVAIILDIALFMMLYISLPHGTSTWREILPGAMGAGLLWELAKKAFLIFVSTYVSISNLIYGSVAGMIAFMVWAYLSGLIFLFGAYLSFSYYQLKHRNVELEGLKQ